MTLNLADLADLGTFFTVPPSTPPPIVSLFLAL
jgi:hypothetical protein